MKQFKLPDVGEGLTEAEIVSWKVKPGDTVKVNEIVVEIETAKSLVELPSPFAGVGGRAARARGHDGRRRHPDHHAWTTARRCSGGAGGAAAATTWPRRCRTSRRDRARRPRRARRAGPDRRPGAGRPDVGAGRLRPAHHRRPCAGRARVRPPVQRVRGGGAAGRADVDDDHADRRQEPTVEEAAECGAGATTAGGACDRRRCTCWPSRRSASWPRTSASTSRR